MLFAAFLVWNYVILSFQCEVKGYQNSPECRGCSDRANMMSKLKFSWDWV